MTIIKRRDLGRPLTWDELDANFEEVDSLVSQANVAVETATTQAQAASNAADSAVQANENAQAAASSAGAAAVAAAQGIYDDFANTLASNNGASLVGTASGETVQGELNKFVNPDGATLYPDLQISRWRDEGDVRGWGAKGDGVTDDTSAFIAAATAVGEGGTLRAHAGVYLLTTVNMVPVSIIGDGQGKTILTFDNASGQNDGIVFTAPTKQDVEFGCRHLSIKTLGGHGRYAINCPRGTGLNGLRPKPTFEHLSFFSEKTNSEFEGFSQVWSWQFMFLLGDAWNLTINRIDAVGCYQAKIDYRAQFLDGFIRSTPAEGILSMRFENTTCHNIANFFEIQQKTYFCLTNIDCARALRGVYDAPDRVFETNRYAYGETIWTNVVINAQLSPIKLDNRFLLIVNGLAIHRAANAYNHGQEWVGISLTRARMCSFQGLEIGTASGYSGTKKGVVLDAGDGNNFTNVAVGLLDVGIQVGVTGSAYGANFGTGLNNICIDADQNVLINLQSCRKFHCDGYGSSSNYTLTTFLQNDDTANNTQTFSNIDGLNQYTDNSLYWFNPSAGTDKKRWRWDTRDGVSFSTQTDVGAAGNSFWIVRRTGTVIDSMELRTKSTTGGFLLLTSPETQCSGLIKPTTDNVNSNGTAAFRWSQIYAGSGSINTSNEEMKTREFADEETSTAEKAAALEIKGDIWRFRFKDAIDIKGDDARIHFGVGAQSVGNILRKHGLDPEQYAFWCKDEWDDIYGPETMTRTITNSDTGESWEEEYETGNQVLIKEAGYQYGIRYDELLCFIIAAI